MSRKHDTDANEPSEDVTGREWKSFAGTNEYKTDLSMCDVDTPVDSVIGCEWHEFDGTHTDTINLTPPEQTSSAPDSQNRLESSMLSCD